VKQRRVKTKMRRNEYKDEPNAFKGTNTERRRQDEKRGAKDCIFGKVLLSQKTGKTNRSVTKRKKKKGRKSTPPTGPWWKQNCHGKRQERRARKKTKPKGQAG